MNYVFETKQLSVEAKVSCNLHMVQQNRPLHKTSNPINSNCAEISPVFVSIAFGIASAILIESGLSFLGIGTQPPMPSWGSMIKDNYQYIILGKEYLAIIPGLAIMLLVTSFMFLGNNLEEYYKAR